LLSIFCLAKKNEYLVDNPTSNTYYFKINNGEENIITSGQHVKVELNRGEKNDIKVFDAQKKLLFDSAFKVTQYRVCSILPIVIIMCTVSSTVMFLIKILYWFLKLLI
jgi:hypothetical protein